MPYKRKEDRKEYRKLNKVKTQKYNKKYQLENKERISLQRKEYREKNREELILKHKEWRDNNPEKTRVYNKKKKIEYKNRPKGNSCKICGRPCTDGFCGGKCRGKNQSEIQGGKNNPSWKGGKVKIICEICGKIEEVEPGCKGQKTCSNKCKGIANIGEQNPNWKNGATTLSHKIRDLREYKIWRKSIFERDDYRCVHCKKRGGDKEAHHKDKSFADILSSNNVVSVKDAKLCEELWDINNGETVCVDCHIDIDEYRFGGNVK